MITSKERSAAEEIHYGSSANTAATNCQSDAIAALHCGIASRHVCPVLSKTPSGLPSGSKNGSNVTWQHSNLQGEYDFSEKSLENSLEFKLPEILEFEVA
jgi:hypothetical protein